MFRRLLRLREAPAGDEPEPSLLEALLSERPSDTFARWARSGRLREIIPDLDVLRDIPQLPAHRDNAFIHTMKVVDAIDPTPIRRWAALLHDIGKGPTFIETPEGRSRFFEHDKVGEVMAEEIMQAAGAGRELIEQVRCLVRLHMRPISYNDEWTDSAVRRLREEAEEGRGPQGWRDLLALSRADLRGYLPEPIDRGLWVLDQLEAHADRLEQEDLQRDALERSAPRSPLDGNDLLALAPDREPGPWVGELKALLEGEVRAGRLQADDRPTAEQVAREWLNQRGTTEPPTSSKTDS